MNIRKKHFMLILLICLNNLGIFAGEYKSINIPIWQKKTNTFKFQNNEFEVSLNPSDWSLNPVVLNKQKKIVFNPDSYVEVLEIIEIDDNKYLFCFSALGFEQYFFYDVKDDKITDVFFDLKQDVTIRKKDISNLVFFGDTWNSDKGIMPDQVVSLYLFSTAKQEHFKIAEKKGDAFNVKLLKDCKIEYTDQNGKLVQFDYSSWIPHNISYTASSFLVEGKTVYGAANLSSKDGLPWASANGYGINDTIQITTPTYNGLQLAFYNGFQSENRPDLYKANSRAKKIRIKNLETGSSKDFTLKDSMEMQLISLLDLNIWSNVNTNLEITILEVYPGEKYKDLCIQAIIPVY